MGCGKRDPREDGYDEQEDDEEEGDEDLPTAPFHINTKPTDGKRYNYETLVRKGLEAGIPMRFFKNEKWSFKKTTIHYEGYHRGFGSYKQAFNWLALVINNRMKQRRKVGF